MARLISQEACASSQLSEHWTCLSTSPETAGSQAPATNLDACISASVPGTVATAHRAARPAQPLGDLLAQDHWYRLDQPLPGGSWIEFGGLAILAEIWFDGVLTATAGQRAGAWRRQTP